MTASRHRGLQRVLERVVAPCATPVPARPLDHRRRAPHPDRQHQRHQRQEHHDAADTHILRQAGPPGRHDHLRRRPHRRAPRGAGRLDRARRRRPDPGPQRPRRGRARDRPRRDPAEGRGLRVERRGRPDQRQLRPPGPAGHPHPARARRGQGRHRPHHPARRHGRPQRRRPLVARPARRVRAPVCLFSLEGVARAWPRHVRRGGRALVLDGWLGRGRGRDPPARSSRSARSRPPCSGWPATTSPTRSRRRRPRGARHLGRRRRRRPAGLPARPPSRLPAVSTCTAAGAASSSSTSPTTRPAWRSCWTWPRPSPAGRRGRRPPVTIIIGTAGDRPDDTLRGIGRIAAQPGRPRGHQGDAPLPPRTQPRIGRRRVSRRPPGRRLDGEIPATSWRSRP